MGTGETKGPARDGCSPFSLHGDLEARTYAELRTIAASYLRRERKDHTLQATALVHEAWINSVNAGESRAADRAQFLAHAAQAMRRVLVQHARKHETDKRGAAARRITLSSDLAFTCGPALDVLALDEALHALAGLDPRQALVVELRFFGGMTVEEVAHALSLSKRAVETDWTFARAWLRRRMVGD